ncbi:YajG family lipoprotein [Magnetospirillum gryphiswaldense]|uniref:Orphan protein n=1 Tax=Magnetospirillum gryphiswaldense TaxID=55518 RepID=A4U3K3_9PROT|nr:hypothetical protein [Magnetospirillum gryphiswaldense]AVM74822.1 hypothetical protein MSR1_23380 [Magnetospirillum gryphiswaldense MSR-1]AVM78725.1 hypothetical protein MSR1L_23380 [Magnetospirillum gryphiswaldense]CAM77460.1 orphan protein [Magnetospirillum gryphiswaldense MSR-1]
MSFKSLCVAFGLTLSLAACAVGNTVDYRDVVPPLGVSGAKSVAVEAVDQRPYVLAGDNTPQWVGMVRGGFGNPFGVHTVSGAPLSSDLTQSIIDSLKQGGVKAVPATARMATDRTLLVTIKNWKSDSMVTTSIYIDAEAEVRDQAGTVLARNSVQERVVNEGEVAVLPPGKLERAKAVFRRLMDQLLNTSIRDALR